ncbi:MAG: hypothetical protein ACYDAL_06345 [Candidatus Dormibacteraceae bacterium]
MEELRSEIRAAFEKEQKAYPPVGGLREDVLHAVSAQPRRAPNLQWLAVAAAVILAALVVFGLMSTRFHPRAAVPGATPNASPLADYGPPPAGVPLLFLKDPNHPSWLIGFDWTGKPRGTVKLDPAIGSVGMAPDGQSFSVGVGAKGGTGELLDRLGQPVAGSGSIPGKAGPIWADDNLHMCGVSLDDQTFEWSLITVLPGQPVKPVAVLARDQGVGQSGIRLASCSFHNDRAVAVRTTIAWPAESWVVRLSDGKVLSHATYERVLSNIIGSADGALVAENSTKSTGDPAAGGPKLIIRRVADGSVVASLDPTLGVLAFSGDDSLVLVTTAPWIGGQPIHLAVVDVKSASIVWRYDGPRELGSYLAQPGGTDFAIALRIVSVSPSQVEDLTRNVLIVGGDGATTPIPGPQVTTW